MKAEAYISKNSFVIFSVCFIVFSGRFAYDFYLPSYNSIASYFSFNDNTIQLTSTLFVLGFGISQLLFGILADFFGKKRVLLLGQMIFFLGIFGSIFVSNPYFFIILRVISGIGCGAGAVLARVIVVENSDESSRLKALQSITNVVLVSMLMAPSVGSLMNVFFGWKGNFLLMSCIILLSIFLILCSSFRTEDNKSQEAGTFFLNKKEFFIIALVNGLSFCSVAAFFQLSPILLMSQQKLTVMEYGVFLSLIALIVICVELFFNLTYLLIPLQWNEKFHLRVGFIFQILGFIFLSFYPYRPLVFYYFFAVCVCLSVRHVSPALLTLFSKKYPMSGLISSLFSSLQILISGFITLIIALLFIPNYITCLLIQGGIVCLVFTGLVYLYVHRLSQCASVTKM